MSRTESAPENAPREGRSGLHASIVVSVVLHLTLLGAFAAVGGFDSAPPGSDAAEPVWTTGDAVEPLSLISTPFEASAPSTAETAMDDLSLPIDQMRPLMPQLAGGGQGAGSPGRLFGASDLSKSVLPLGGGGSGNGTGTGIGDGEGAGNGPGFFGRAVRGNRVVFVVDGSQSMNHPHPGPQKSRIGRVKLELVRSIRGMNDQQKFFIIFFNERAWPMPAERMVPADEATKLKYLRWMVDIKPDGKTDPSEALMMALGLNPDEIYFLTDGDFRPAIVPQIASANRRGVVIHTIGFSENRGEPLLRAIATQSGGTYLFIPATVTEGSSSVGFQQPTMTASGIDQPTRTASSAEPPAMP